MDNVESRTFAEQINRIFAELQGKREILMPVPTLSQCARMCRVFRQCSKPPDRAWRGVKKAEALRLSFDHALIAIMPRTVSR